MFTGAQPSINTFSHTWSIYLHQDRPLSEVKTSYFNCSWKAHPVLLAVLSFSLKVTLSAVIDTQPANMPIISPCAHSVS